MKGYQVPPAELEDLLRGHPAVLDVAVIGVPDEKTGELPRDAFELENTLRGPPAILDMAVIGQSRLLLFFLELARYYVRGS